MPRVQMIILQKSDYHTQAVGKRTPASFFFLTSDRPLFIYSLIKKFTQFRYCFISLLSFHRILFLFVYAYVYVSVCVCIHECEDQQRSGAGIIRPGAEGSCSLMKVQYVLLGTKLSLHLLASIFKKKVTSGPAVLISGCIVWLPTEKLPPAAITETTPKH